MHTTELPIALIVDGLALSATSADLKELFMPFGSVVWCRIALDRWGNSLRYAYVVMDTEGTATKAVEALNGATLAGLPITVTRTGVPPLPRIA